MSLLKEYIVNIYIRVLMYYRKKPFGFYFNISSICWSFLSDPKECDNRLIPSSEMSFSLRFIEKLSKFFREHSSWETSFAPSSPSSLFLVKKYIFGLKSFAFIKIMKNLKFKLKLVRFLRVANPIDSLLAPKTPMPLDLFKWKYKTNIYSIGITSLL